MTTGMKRVRVSWRRFLEMGYLNGWKPIWTGGGEMRLGKRPGCRELWTFVEEPRVEALKPNV